MRVIAVLRSLGVSWPKIRRAEQWMRDKTGYRRPFAVERVWTETEDVFAEFPEGFVAASRRGQLAFVELFNQYLQPVEDMTFVHHNDVSVAATWTPHQDVMMNPKIQLGEPCVVGTRIRTHILWLMSNGGDSTEYLTRAFNLTVPQIEHSLEWENRLRTIQAS